jgi:3-oxoacyl-[acyl-carrier protein] reductase
MTTSSNQPLEGRVAVIAGGAGAIGYATARRLARTGARVVLLTKDAVGDAQEQAAQLEGAGHGAVQASITDSSTLKQAAQQVLAQWGRVDILVNSAGFTKPVAHKNLDELDDDLIDQLFAANWRGVFATIRAFAPALKMTGDGLVVSVSSIAATTGIGSNVAYCAAKAGVDVMTKALGRALAPEIRVLSVSPGVVDSDFVPGRDKAWNEKTAASTPLRRVGTPDDIAAAVEACATTLTYATGTVIQIDGGRSLGAS